MAVKVRVEQSPLKVRVGQSDAIKILSTAPIGTNIVKSVSGGTADVTALNVSGITTFSDDVKFIGANTNARWDHSTSDLILFDNTRLEFGSNKDFEIWHGGAHTNLKNSGGDLRIRGDKILLKRADDSERYLEANVNQGVKLFFNGVEKCETTVDGLNITGDANVTGTLTAGLIDGGSF